MIEQALAGFVDADPVHPRVVAREQFVPDSVVVMKVEESPVHVEEDGVDLIPVDQSVLFKRLLPLADMIRTLSRADATGYLSEV